MLKNAMQIRWLLILLASSAAAAPFPADAPADSVQSNAKSNASHDFYEMLLRYVAENAFKERDTRKVDEPYYAEPDWPAKSALSKSDGAHYEADHYEPALRTGEPAQYQQTSDDSTAAVANVDAKDRPASHYYYYYPVKKGSGSYGAAHKGKDKDVLWDIFEAVSGKKKFKFEEALFHWLSDSTDNKGHYSSYGRPSGRPTYTGSHGGHEPSKADVFAKVKLLAVASTALLIVLGGLILLAPLIVAKGRSAFVRAQAKSVLESADFAELTERIVNAIRSYRP